MTIVKGKLIPIRNNILITDMNFDERKTAGGIILQSDDGKSEGVRHRWGKVWAIGPEQKDVKVGDWILLEHGRWSRGATIELEDGSEQLFRRADPNGILMVSEEQPDESMLNTFGQHAKVDHQTFDPSTFARPSFEQ
jgi:co-chaperonin GroES (HSP10)